MRILKLIPPVLVGLVLLCAAYFALVFSTPARAQECLSIDVAIGIITANNGEFVDIVDVKEQMFDQLVLITIDGKHAAAGAKDGCLVTPFILYSPAAKGESA